MPNWAFNSDVNAPHCRRLTWALGIMSSATIFAFIVLLALLLFFKQGISLATVLALLVAATLAAIPWYLGTRDGSAEPSRLEGVLATLWVWFRRIVGVGAGAIFLWAGWAIARSGTLSGGTTNPWLAGFIVALMGLFCIYVGIVGQGWRRADWRDDVALHRANKRRYKWWF